MLVKVFPKLDTLTTVRKPKAMDVVNKFHISFYDNNVRRWTIVSPVRSFDVKAS